MKLFSLTFILLLSFTISAQAENSQNFGDITVDYSIFPSTFITPQVAKTYGIKRSKYENLINVFVSKDGIPGGLKINISGKASNLMQQQQALNFTEISEEDTVYYIAPIKVSSDETLHFNINCKILSSGKELQVKFTKKLYKN